MNKRFLQACILFVIGLLIVTSAPVVGCAQAAEQGKSAEKPIPAKIIKRLEAMLPDAQQMGTKLDGEKEYYGENLYELINGAAGVFHDYGFVALGHAIYKKGEPDITVDIYYMGNPLNAFGIFSAESSPDYHFIDTGAAGYLEEGILNFLQGPFYVKLSSYGDDEELVKTLLTSFADKVSESIKGGKALPKNLRLLPKKDMVAHSQGYSNKAPLGYQFLSPAITAEYAFGEDRTTVLLSMADAPEDAAARVQKMREQVSKTGAVSDMEGLGEGAFRGKDKYRGEIIGFTHGKEDQPAYAVFVVKPPENVEPLLKRIKRSLNRAK